jgi:hypothetical protein
MVDLLSSSASLAGGGADDPGPSIDVRDDLINLDQ